jgi:transcriptional regulator with XRE-family HTH domain
MNNIQKYIKDQRKVRGLTQLQLSEIAEVSRTHLAKIESGKFSPSVETIQKLLHGLGLKLTIVPIDPEELPKDEAWKELLDSLD